MSVMDGFEAQPAERILQGWPVFKSVALDSHREDVRALSFVFLLLYPNVLGCLACPICT